MHMRCTPLTSAVMAGDGEAVEAIFEHTVSHSPLAGRLAE